MTIFPSAKHSPRHHWRLGSIVATALAIAPLSTLWLISYAQTFTEEEVSSYATAVLAMENIRVEAYSDVSDLMTSQQLDVTNYDLRCLTANSLKDVPGKVQGQTRKRLIEYCNSAKQIVEDSGLTVRKFNSMTATHYKDEGLREQIQSELGQRL